MPPADLVQNPSFSGGLSLRPALKHWHGNPASAPLSTPQHRWTWAKLLLASHQTHRIPLIHSTLIRVSSPISLPSAVLLVIETLPMPQVTTTLASARMGQIQPSFHSALSLLSMPGHLLMPLDSSIEQKGTEFPPCTKFSSGKCLSPIQCSRQYALPHLPQSLSPHTDMSVFAQSRC